MGPVSALPPIRDLKLFCYGLEVRVIDVAGTELCRRLHDTLPPEFTGTSELTKAVVSYSVTHDLGIGGGTGYRVTCQGVEAFESSEEQEVLHWLGQHIDSTVARRSGQMLFVHAGVVGWRGLAIIIPGRSLTGKSTLV